MTVVKSSIDSYVDEDRPAANFGKAIKLWMNGGGGSNDRYSYIFFARPFPIGATVASAILKLNLAGDWAGANTITAKRITERWKESTIRWQNRPTTSATDAGTVNVAALPSGTEVEIDLTDMLGAVALDGEWFGIRLEVDTNGNRAVCSSDHPTAERRPVLEIEWSEAPQPPTNLAPSGARAVSKAAPILAWQFVDLVGSTEQSASQVQVHSTADFSGAVDYDSGKEANTQPFWNLDLDVAFSDLADSETAFWRVKVWDGTDLESEWSEVVEFERRTQGTLTITNPDVAPANIVEETTPPIAWTLTGKTQEAFAIVLHRVEASGTLTQLASQGRTVSTDEEWEVPSGLLREGDTYRVDLYTWDTVDRQGITGDPAWVYASRTFTYERAETPDPVTALTAEAVGAAVFLTWERSTDPDYFAIRANDRLVYDRLEPADCFVSGDEYAFEFLLAKPRRVTTFEVEAVVNDGGVLKHSGDNATDQTRTNPVGIWLVDPEDNLGVLIAGKEKASMVIGEVSALYDPLGSRAPVRITDNIQGYEGAFNGVILDEEGRDAFLTLKGRLSTLRLIIGDLNIPVELGIVSSIPSPIGDEAGYDVSFEFFQVGEFDQAFEVAGG